MVLFVPLFAVPRIQSCVGDVLIVLVFPVSQMWTVPGFRYSEMWNTVVCPRISFSEMWPVVGFRFNEMWNNVVLLSDSVLVRCGLSSDYVQ